MFSFEKQLAEASLTKVERRDPERVYNKRTWEEAQGAAAPGLDLGEYFRTVGEEVAEVSASLELNLAVEGSVVFEAVEVEAGSRVEASAVGEFRQETC